jgi:hypothetical protein
VEEKEMNNKKIFIPSSGPDDWMLFLADPEKTLGQRLFCQDNCPLLGGCPRITS